MTQIPRNPDAQRRWLITTLLVGAALPLLPADLLAAGRTPHLIGGADVAAELDAKRAIDQGSRLAARL